MHCKDVSVMELDVPVTEGSIAKALDGRSAYTRTEFTVIHNGDEYAVVEIFKGQGSGLFKPISDYRVVSLPEDTVFVDDPDIDVLNTPAMALLQSRFPGKTIVVRGMFSHINFVTGIEPITLRVIDNVPPSPSKLGVLVGKALDSGFVDHPIVVDSIEIDMKDSADDVTTEAVMFPCAVSGLRSERPFYYLDAAPKLDREVTLIGCATSKRIYQELYGSEPVFVNVCPMDHVPDDGVRTIVKCCKIKEGHQIEGSTAKVPWGATVPEVVDAINALFE